MVGDDTESSFANTSASYPWLFCETLATDILTFAQQNTASTPTSFQTNLAIDVSNVILWACARCRHGLKYPDGTLTPEHTKDHRCRFSSGEPPTVAAPDIAASPVPVATPIAPPGFPSASSSSTAAFPMPASSSATSPTLVPNATTAES